MKNHLLLTVLGALALSGFTLHAQTTNAAPTATDTTTAAAPSSAPIRIACVGDSITHGARAQAKDAYPAQLQRILGAGYSVQNFGLSGRTLLKAGDHSYWKEKALQDAQTFQPNIVIIMLGTNDTKPQNWVHIDQFTADYKDLIETFKKLPTAPKIFICRPNPVYGAGAYGINEANLDQEIPLIDKIAKDEGVGLIDMHAALAGHPENEPDNVHPNAAGYLIMAQTVAAALTGKTP
jgi:lysophospholipase L1-like esterase